MGLLSARAEVWLAGAAGTRPATALRRLARGRSFSLDWDLAGSLDAELDRWFLWVPVCFGIGVGFYFASPLEPSWALALAPLIAAVGLRLGVRAPGAVLLAATAALVCIALGIAAAKVRTEWVRAPVVGNLARPLQVEGWVEAVERRGEKGARLTIRVAHVAGLAPELTPERVRVSSRYDNLAFAPGDTIAILAKLMPPPEPAAPGGYDFARAAWFKGLGAVGFGIGRPEPAPRLGPLPFWRSVLAAVERWREDISLRITTAMPGPGGLVIDALVTGEQGSIPRDVVEALRDSGLSHLLAISGLQITIMAGAFFLLARVLLAAVPRIALNWPVKKIATAAGLLGATVYVVMSGAGSATVRAYVMVAVALIAVLLDRPAISMRNLAIAALVLIVPAPETLLDPSFQMSFSAVVALMAAYEWGGKGTGWSGGGGPGAGAGAGRPVSSRMLRQRSPAFDASLPWSLRAGYLMLDGSVMLWRVLRETIAATTIATLAVAPFALFTFHRLPVYGVLANVLAEPLFNLVIMPLVAVVLVAMPFGLEAFPLMLVDLCVGLLVAIAKGVQALPGAVVLVPQMPMLALGVITLGGAWLCLWRLGWRYLGLAGIALGMLLSLGGTAPDIFIGREGATVAVRLPGGELSALPGRGGAFELARWLEADADGRGLPDVRGGEGFRCDGLGCTALVAGGQVLAISDAPASLADDCAAAQIVVLRYRQLAPCRGPVLVLDARDLRAGGVHAIRFEAGRPVIDTVARSRGVRPWSEVPAAVTQAANAPSLVEVMASPGRSSRKRNKNP